MHVRSRDLDRRHMTRGNVGHPDRIDLVSTIIGMYREMPGLSLTFEQAARLFGLPLETTRIILRDLVDGGLLELGANGQYLRGSWRGDSLQPPRNADDKTIDDVGRTA
jgi:hypothetical protein